MTHPALPPLHKVRRLVHLGLPRYALDRCGEVYVEVVPVLQFPQLFLLVQLGMQQMLVLHRREALLRDLRVRVVRGRPEVLDTLAEPHRLSVQERRNVHHADVRTLRAVQLR